MLVTNKERMSQLASAIDSNLNILRDALSNRNMLEEPASNIVPNVTIGNILVRIKDITDIIAAKSDDAPKYWASIKLPYTEDTFPVER